MVFLLGRLVAPGATFRKKSSARLLILGEDETRAKTSLGAGWAECRAKNRRRQMKGVRQPGVPSWPHSLLEKLRVLKVRGLTVVDGGSIVPMGKKREAQIQQHFGGRVRELRKQKGLSQEGLALACNLDRSYIGGVERGERNISLLNIQKIADALGVSARELF